MGDVVFYERDGNDVNMCPVFGNDMSRCSVFSEGRKNEMAKFVRFLVLEIFAKGLIK